ncbi:MAG TPA: hypothetical protein VM103_01970 [Candidatus Paceibacterota bacterium]|nr:hypothetical protein [Candidatus Paceibacterota bacterium]
MRNTILIFGVLTAVGIVGFWIPHERAKQPSPQPMTASGEAEIVVKYTEHGFDPQTITVAVGTTVAWVDTSGRPMWVGSDPHPTHTDLPGFDQLRVINRANFLFVRTAYAHGNDVYEYTFTKVGAWKYHNHINPSDRGTVIVIERPSSKP